MSIRFGLADLRNIRKDTVVPVVHQIICVNNLLDYHLIPFLEEILIIADGIVGHLIRVSCSKSCIFCETMCMEYGNRYIELHV